MKVGKEPNCRRATVRWEGQVEKALRSPWADSILTAAVREDQEEAEGRVRERIRRKGRLQRPRQWHRGSLVPTGVCTGRAHDGRRVTEEVVDVVVATEWKEADQGGQRQRQQEPQP